MGYYEHSTDDQIRTSFVSRSFKAWKQYKMCVTGKKYEVTLLLCVLQAALTNLLEFYDNKDHRDPDSPLAKPITDIPKSFGLSTVTIEKWESVSDAKKNTKNIRNVLEVVRHALSHPTVDGPNKLDTGYATYRKDDSDEIKGFVFCCYQNKRRINLSIEEIETILSESVKFLTERLPVEARDAEYFYGTSS
jgi:hypothetical protein